MSRVTEVGMEDVEGQGRSSTGSDEPEARSEVRWSARRKEGVVRRSSSARRSRTASATGLPCGFARRVLNQHPRSGFKPEPTL
jgi:hypothetical protein